MHKPFKTPSRLNTVTLSVRLRRELVVEFLAACERELGSAPRKGGDAARRVVLERLIREYIASQQPREQP